jgi:hypothetical protein
MESYYRTKILTALRVPEYFIYKKGYKSVKKLIIDLPLHPVQNVHAQVVILLVVYRTACVDTKGESRLGYIFFFIVLPKNQDGSEKGENMRNLHRFQKPRYVH